jgi:multidrug efflux pump subunit AcrB
MKIKDLGLSTTDVISTIQAAFSGGRLAYFIMNGYQYYVIAQVERDKRNTTADITNLYVRNNKGVNIPLDAVVKLVESSNPPTLYIITGINQLLFPPPWRKEKPLGMVLTLCRKSRINYSMKLIRFH